MSNEESKGYQQEVLLVDTESLEVHELAGVNPMMTPRNLEELRSSFESYNGFDKQFPITLYHGKVIDGRHRLIIAKEMRLDKVYCKSLPQNLTHEQAKGYAVKTDSRRHVTATQKAISAYHHWVESMKSGENITQTIAAKDRGSSRRYLALVNSLEKLAGSDVIDELWNGSKIIITSKYGKKTSTDSLSILVAYFKERAAEQVLKPVDPKDPYNKDNYTAEEMKSVDDLLTTVGSTLSLRQQAYLNRQLYFQLKGSDLNIGTDEW